MSIPVTLLTFNKRENSTLKPSTAQISEGTTLDCLLMDNTSLMNPTFKLNVVGNPVGFNYCYVPSFERYPLTMYSAIWSRNITARTRRST